MLFSFCWKYEYAGTDFSWKYKNAKWRCTPFCACPPSQLPAQLPSISLGRCRTSILQSAQKAPFDFKTLWSATTRAICFCQSKWAAIAKVKLVVTVGSRQRFKTLACHERNVIQENLLKKGYYTFPWTHRTIEGSQSFCGTRGRFVIFPAKGHWQATPAWVSSLTRVASSSGCNRYSGFAELLWGAASSRSL